MTRRALLGGLALDILTEPPPKADARIFYGSHPQQFGDLRLPRGRGPHPAVIYLHGGFWKAAYSLEHAGHACAALTKAGAVTWSLEYRRIGDAGGGWPGTFDDVKQGAAYLKELARSYPIDLQSVTVAGHSAGGHLAVWLAAQRVLELRAAVSLAGVLDLKRAWELRLSNGIVGKLMGGTPEDVPDRYAKADPAELVPIAVPQRLVHGTGDDVVPLEISERFAGLSGNARLIAVDGAGHYDLIDPHSSAWKAVLKAIF